MGRNMWCLPGQKQLQGAFDKHAGEREDSNKVRE